MLTTWIGIPALEYLTGRFVDLFFLGIPAATWALVSVPAITGSLGGSIPVSLGFAPSLVSLAGPVGSAAGSVLGAAGPVVSGITGANMFGELLSSLFRLFYGISAGLA